VCEITVDCRLLPDQSQDEAEAIVREALGDGDYDFEWIQGQGGTRSPLESPLFDAIDEFVQTIEPEARAVPVIVAGFTDSHWMREAFGTVAYGFFPSKAMDPETAALLIHSANERVPVDDLELGVEFLRHVARGIGGIRL
jgi:acetylornithine deacetylase/succinyl-diaminopimelate desuccinylase-like protein